MVSQCWPSRKLGTLVWGRNGRSFAVPSSGGGRGIPSHEEKVVARSNSEDLAKLTFHLPCKELDGVYKGSIERN